MTRLVRRLPLLFLLACLGLPAAPLSAAGPEERDRLALALAQSMADRIDATFEAAARGVAALGREYAALRKSLPEPDAAFKDAWRRKYALADQTVAFQSWSGAMDQAPKAQAPCPAFLYYDGENFTDETFRNLAAFERLAGAFRAAYETFPFSWVYLTAADESFLIYPFLPLADGLANHQPTKKLFYTVADFKNRTFGWQSPYLDLAGEGMMITVSWPIFEGDALLGVSSRDVTLRQLSRDVLVMPSDLRGAVAFLMDKRGKAIGAGESGLAVELDAVNSKAGDAILHYRTAEGLKKLGKDKAAASASSLADAVGERVVAETSKEGAGDALVFVQDERTVAAVKIRTTGWRLVLILPQ